MDSWYVVRARDEYLAKRSVGDLGIEVYLPEYQRRIRTSHKVNIVLRPLFPNYLFASFDIDTNPKWPLIFSRRGVQGMICDGYQRPKRVPDAQMDWVRSIALGYEDTVYDSVPLSPKDVVTITGGLFKDTQATVRRADPNAVSVTVRTSSGLEIVLPRDYVEPVAA